MHKYSPQTIIKPRTRGGKPHLHQSHHFFHCSGRWWPIFHTHQILHIFPLRPHTDRMETLGSALQSYGQHKYVKVAVYFRFLSLHFWLATYGARVKRRGCWSAFSTFPSPNTRTTFSVQCILRHLTLTSPGW